MSKTPEEQLIDARINEEENLQFAQENGHEYQVKTFEILE